MTPRHEEIIGLLHSLGCSCVIDNGTGSPTVCHERGIKDLFIILKEQASILDGSFIADKVVGKGAAALMAIGHVSAVYADVISRPALELLAGEGIDTTYGQCVANIVNRAGTGICPVEQLCADCLTPAECLGPIERFIELMNTKTDN